MRTIKTAFGLLLASQLLMGTCSTLHAQTTSASFGVTIVLRTFSEAATADHRCTHRGQANGQKGTLSINCPATVDVQAIARASSRKTEALQRTNATGGQPDQTSLAVVAGKPMNSAGPVELTISW
jgi:hypothetical protein